MAVPDTTRCHSRAAQVVDPYVTSFLSPSFDAAEHLNAILPQLAVTSVTANAVSASVSLAQASAQVQTVVSTLNAQTSRLSTTLTQMADDILRSGGRLAYQVELLRGEAIGLNEVFTEDAQNEIRMFAPSPSEKPEQQKAPTMDPAAESSYPEFISQLKMLAQVRSRLEAVIKIFGEAMQWTLPPSELSLASSFISVSGPEPGSDSQSREEKGREFSERLRNEIADLVAGTGQVGDGYVAAMQRIEALRYLSVVWKGTSEEKARARFIDGLVRLAEERAKSLERDASRQKQSNARVRSGSQDNSTKSSQSENPIGFLENLQKLRSGTYLD